MKKETLEELLKIFTAMKRKYENALLLIRQGDNYISFYEDAIIIKRMYNNKKPYSSEIQHFAFPFYALDLLLSKLVKAGHRVAVCDPL